MRAQDKAKVKRRIEAFLRTSLDSPVTLSGRCSQVFGEKDPEHGDRILRALPMWWVGFWASIRISWIFNVFRSA